jgi:uncharacterized membrane protein (DUF485 family)
MPEPSDPPPADLPPSSPPALPRHHEDHPEVISRNARRGLVLFLIYFAMYAAFLLVNVFSPETMARTTISLPRDRELSLGGPNLAVAGGIGLIFAAIVLALVYMRAARTRSGGSP